MSTTPSDRHLDRVAAPARSGRRLTRWRGVLGCVLCVVSVAHAAGPPSDVVASSHAEQARRPLLREKIDDRFVEDPDPFARDVCGIEVRVEGRVWGHSVQYGDLTVRQHLNIKFTWTDPRSGETLLVERDAETFFQVPISETIDEQAGTLTVVYETRITGLPLKGVVPGEGVILRDAGWIEERVTVVVDLATGEVVTVDGQFLDSRGPHPFAELTRDERDAVFCSALVGRR